MSDLIKALQIFLKYGDPRHPTWCEHDCLHVCVPADKVSDEDKKALAELSFHADDDGYSSYRFGSA